MQVVDHLDVRGKTVDQLHRCLPTLWRGYLAAQLEPFADNDDLDRLLDHKRSSARRASCR